MPVNESLSTFSDYAYSTAVAIYVLAMIFFTAEQAFGRGHRKAAQDQARELVTADGASVSADSPQTTTGTSSTTGTTGTPATGGRRSVPDRLGRMGLAVTVLGILLHAGSLVLRGLATGRVPWGNMYEYMSIVCLASVVSWLVLLRRYPVRHATTFLLLPTVIMMFIGGTALYAEAAPLQPALQSYWIVIHVSAAASSSGLLLVPGVASVLYLIKRANLTNPGRFARLSARLPGMEPLDRIAYRTTIFAFPVYTFGIICGAIWAESAWGRFWGWDPKEAVAFVAWVIYAAYLHSRATSGWRGTRAAVINTVGFVAIVFNLFFVNLVTSGLHSYAGVS